MNGTPAMCSPEEGKQAWKYPNYHFKTLVHFSWIWDPTNHKIPKLEDTPVINTPPLLDGERGK